MGDICFVFYVVGYYVVAVVAPQFSWHFVLAPQSQWSRA